MSNQELLDYVLDYVSENTDIDFNSPISSSGKVCICGEFFDVVDGKVQDKEEEIDDSDC